MNKVERLGMSLQGMTLTEEEGETLIQFVRTRIKKEKLNYVAQAREALAKELVEVGEVEDDLLDLFTLLVLTTGEETSLEDVHEAWGIWTNRINPTHRSLIPFNQLTEEVQQCDEPYRSAIEGAASRL